MNPIKPVYGYLRENRILKPVATLSALLLTVTVVWLMAPPDLKKHITAREVLHIGFAGMLYALFWRLVTVAERLSNKGQAVYHRYSWAVRYFGPMAILLTINSINEFGFAMTGEPKGWPEGEPLIRLGGDWARALVMAKANDYYDMLKWKSIADLAAWAFGALTMAWFLYKEGESIWHARSDRLRWQHDREGR